MKKNVVITGGSKGIGRALVEAFAAEGHTVFTCSRHLSDLQTLQVEVLHTWPEAEVQVFQADLSQREETLAFAAFVQQVTPHIDVLVNNSGYFLPGQIHNEAEGTLEKMLETNLHSAYHFTRALLPGMMARRQGHVFNVCSTASNTAYTNGGSYCISKFALYGMSQVLREELKEYGIRVTSVLPGATLTASWQGTSLPEERFMPPHDVAAAIMACWKLSDRTVVEDLLLRPQLGDIN
jgi:short-subunit dehydrogenase